MWLCFKRFEFLFRHYLPSKSQRGGEALPWHGPSPLMGFCWLSPQFSGVVNQVCSGMLSLFFCLRTRDSGLHLPLYLSFIVICFVHPLYPSFEHTGRTALHFLLEDFYHLLHLIANTATSPTYRT